MVTKLKLAELDEDEQKEIREAGLWELHRIMTKTIDEAIAKEAVCEL